MGALELQLEQVAQAVLALLVNEVLALAGSELSELSAVTETHADR